MSLEISQNSQENRSLRRATLVKKRPWHRRFPVNFAKLLRTPFRRTPLEWYGKTRVTSYELWVTSYELKAQKHELKFKSASSNPRVTSLNPRVTTSNPPVTSSNPRIIKSLKTQVNSLKSCSFPKILSPKLFGNS